MYIFFIVVWIIAIYCIFRNFEVDNNLKNVEKNIEKNVDPEDDPDYSKLELNLRDIINNQVLDDDINADNSKNKKNN
jgi:hypothetical protein